MQLFYFNLRTPQGLQFDRKGRRLPSAESAYLEAYQVAPLLAMEVFSLGGDLDQYTLEVMNEAGQLIWDLPFRETLRRVLRPRWQDPSGVSL